MGGRGNRAADEEGVSVCLCVSDVCYGRPPPSCQGAVV